jgi:hypothetical protein
MAAYIPIHPNASFKRHTSAEQIKEILHQILLLSLLACLI